MMSQHSGAAVPSLLGLFTCRLAEQETTTPRCAMRFPTYHSLKDYLWSEYKPLREEVREAGEGRVPGTNWARRHAPRFNRALQAIEKHVRPGTTLLDIGAYPGSFPRLARECFGDSLRIFACGMPGTQEFQNALAREGIEFRPCNLDPQVTTSVELPQGASIAEVSKGLPFESKSIDFITCMEVVEHLFSLKTILTECSRVLKPGGILYLTTNNIMDRVALLRLFRSGDTNLDNQLDVTTIWSDEGSPRRGHVRFYSVKQLIQVGALAGLQTWRTDYFQQYEDPDVYHWNDRGLLGALRKWLRGRGASPPLGLRTLAQCVVYLGPRSLSRRFRTHLEIKFRKPERE
jgi:SAM-dependent methyltransferase